VISLNPLMRLLSFDKAMGWCTSQRKMLLFCAKTIVKESHNLAHLKKKKKKKRTFWFGTLMMLLAPLGVLFIMKILEDER